MKLHWSAVLAGLLLGCTAEPEVAADPPTVQGHFQFGANRYELRHAQAVRSPYDPQRLWILLTSAQLSAKDAADASRTMKLAASGKLRGVRWNVDAAAPNPNELQGELLLSKDESPGGAIVFGAGGQKHWERLILSDKRMLGTLRYGMEAGSFSGTPAWALELDFNVPVPSAR
jgi:hypothetical protein